MTVYVDKLIRYHQTASTEQGKLYFGNGKQSCHMSTDTDDLTELHELAAKIGLKRAWFQDHKTMPHYDLTPIKRALAIRAGAIAIEDQVEFVKKCSKLLRKQNDNRA
jgi:hypothetical protein